ncbi:extracellular solute-binding protein [Peribacillus sp. SI8-4]|uniref:extracellular solute-binding protein n=1 Tax=Peribacillus sp. SI8-4 TaxID=3048009 RepID=UPI0025576D63|nr:extracellular solute-binding protein [Peribacillus sp. SI8-4]
MKKQIFHLIMSIFLIMVASACGIDSAKDNRKILDDEKPVEEATDEAKPEKMVIWEEKGKAEALKPMIEKFEKEYGIEIVHEELEIAREMHDRLRRDGPIGNGKTPDVVTFSHQQIGQLVKEGLIQEVKVEKEVLNAFHESTIRAEMYQDKVFGLPKSVNTSVLIYNKKMLSKAPETMNDLYKISKEYRKKNVYGYHAEWNGFHDAYGVMAGMGSYVFKDKKGHFISSDVGLNDKHAIKAAAYIQKWYKADLIPNGDKAAIQNLFRQGKLASFLGDANSISGNEETGMAHLPELPNGKPVKPFLEVKGWHVTAFTKHPYWSTKLVEYLTNDEQAWHRYEATGDFPPNKSIGHAESIKDKEKAQALSIQLQYAEPVPNIPEMNKVWGPMDSAMNRITMERAKPKRTLDEAVKAIKKQ